jgi:hypothetical protein
MKFRLLLSCTLALTGMAAMSANADVRIAKIENGVVTTPGCTKTSVGGGGGTIAYRYTCPLGEAYVAENRYNYSCTLTTSTSGYYTTGSCAYSGGDYYSVWKTESTSSVASTSAPATTSSSTSTSANIPAGNNCTWNSSASYGSGYTLVYVPVSACQDKYKVVNTQTGQVTYTR